MTPAERALAVAITLGVWLGIVVRAVLCVLVVLVLVAGGLVLLGLSMFRGVQQVERGTRPW